MEKQAYKNRRFAEEEKAKGVRFLYEKWSELEDRDRKILHYFFEEGLCASAIARLNDNDIVSQSNRAKGKPLSATSILRCVYVYFPELENRAAKSRNDKRIALIRRREKQVSPHIKQCAFCGATGQLEEHHMIPLFAGGDNEEANLIFLCHDCHKQVTAYQRKWKKQWKSLNLA